MKALLSRQTPWILGILLGTSAGIVGGGCKSADGISRKDGGQGPDAPISSGGSSSVGGSGGNTLVGGSGGLARTGGSSGSTLVGGSGGSGGAMATDEVCRAALGAICDRFATCAGRATADVTTLARPCDNIAAACPDFFFNEASTRAVAGVTASIAELAALSCSDLDLGLRPASWTPGTSPVGAPCARVSNCQSGACSGGNMQCGSCVGDMVASGESCAKGSACRPGDFCHPTTKLCTQASTIVHRGLGEACDLAAVPAVGCTGESSCVTPDGVTAGTCGQRQAPIVVGAGQSCDSRHICGPNLTCFTTTTSTGDGSYTSSPSTCVPTDTCGTTSCDETTFCKTADGGRYCAPLAAAGERCLGDGGSMTTYCASDLTCSVTTGLCTAFGQQGDTCDDGHPCAAYFPCLAGRCTPLSTQTCSLAKRDSGG